MSKEMKEILKFQIAQTGHFVTRLLQDNSPKFASPFQKVKVVGLFY